MRSGWPQIVLLSGVLALVGCRGMMLRTPLPETHEVPVQQLVFHCDFDLPDDHRLVRELTSERDDVANTLRLPTTDELIHVHLFRDAQAYDEFRERYFPTAPSRRAFFLESDTLLAVYAHWSDRVAEDLRHEVAHGYLHAAVPNLPLWLDEGLAEYFEVPRGHGGLNHPHMQLLADMVEHDHWQPDVQRLEQLEQWDELDQRDYAESWAWVYYMLESSPETRQLLTDYLAELRAHGSAEPLSTRLAARHIQPAEVLAEYVVALRTTTDQ